MRIYSNPNFPSARPERAAPRERPPRRERIDTPTFLSELQARNAKALEALSDKRPQEPRKHAFDRTKPAPIPHTVQTGRGRKSNALSHRFSGFTGPPIEVPGGHVHEIHGSIEFGRRYPNR